MVYGVTLSGWLRREEKRLLACRTSRNGEAKLLDEVHMLVVKF